MAVIPPGYAAASIEWWLDGYPRPAVTTMGLNIVGTEAPFGYTLADQWFSAMVYAFTAETDQNVTLRNARVVVGQDGGEPLVFESSSSQRGAKQANRTPPSLAVMFSKNTALGGRANRGRFFAPWLVADQNVLENGSIVPAAMALMEGCAERLYEHLTDDDPERLILGPVLLHGDPERPPTAITGFTPNPTIRTQRRRQVRY